MLSHIKEFKEYNDSNKELKIDTNIMIDKIDNIYIPLKETENICQNGYISSIEGMRDFNIKEFNIIKQNSDVSYINANKKTHLIVELNDNIMTRLFIGGISAVGVIAIYNLLYKKGVYN